MFLALNRYRLEADTEQAVELMVGIASGVLDERARPNNPSGDR